MPFNEAAFWVGLTVAGTGLYFLIEGETKRRLMSGALTLAGILVMVYSVYLHANPNTAVRVPTWGWLFGLTWLALVYDIYDRRQLWEQFSKGPHPTVDMLEKGRQEQLAKRERLIESWRAMVLDVDRQLQSADDTTSTTKLLERHPAFLTFRPYMGERTRAAVFGGTMTVPPSQSTMNGTLFAVLSDIEAIAKKWGID